MISNVTNIQLQDPQDLQTDINGASIQADIYNLSVPLSVNEPIEIKTNNFTFTWKPTELVYKDENNNYDYIVGSSPSELSIIGKQARYKRTYPFADDIFHAQKDRIKHWTILNEKPRQHAEYLSGKVYFGVSGIVNGMPMLEGIYNEIILEDYTLPQPIIKDLIGNEIYGFYEVVGTDDGQQLFIWFDADYFNNAIYPVMIDPTVVVSSAYTTNANTRPQILNNGWIVTCLWDSITPALRLYVSKDNGATWAQLCLRTLATWVSPSFSITSFGTNIYMIYVYPSGTAIISTKFDASVIANVELTTTSFADTGQTSFGAGASIAINSAGTVITAVWCSRNSTYPNSLNIRSAKSTDGGVTWTKQDSTAGVDQITNNNTTGFDATYPFMQYDKNNVPIIIYQFSNNSNSYVIGGYTYNGSTFTVHVIYNSILNYIQSNSTTILKKNGANIGRIWAAWHGIDSTDTSKNNIRVSYSDDNGITWSAMQKLTSGNTVNRQNPTLSEKPNGDIICMYEDNGTIVYQTCANGGTTFTGLTTIGTGTNPSIQDYAVNNIINYIWKTATNVSADKFTFNSPPLAPTGLILANFDATQSTNFTWTFVDPDAGNTQSAYQLQIIRVSNGVTVLDTGKVTSINSNYTLSAGTLTNGQQYQWKVNTWDNSDSMGVYSTLSTFTTSTAPLVTITTPSVDGTTVNGSNITTTWNFNEADSGVTQASYQVRLTDNSDIQLYSSGQISDAVARALTIPYTLVNATNYKIKITLWNSMGIASTETARTFATSFTPPSIPTLYSSVNNDNGSVLINIINSSSIAYNDIYRKEITESTFIRIATNISNSGNYTDYTPASNKIYDYKVVSIANNGTSISALMNYISLNGIQNAFLSSTSDYTNYVELVYSPKNTKICKQEITYNKFAGRKKPVPIAGIHVENSNNISFIVNDVDTLCNLESLIESKSILLFRNFMGEKIYCLIDNYTKEYISGYTYQVILPLNEIDFSEVV